jgi:transcription initiation factor TFIIIB Brf1 subunit/transcription initiation factor TFIIB
MDIDQLFADAAKARRPHVSRVIKRETSEYDCPFCDLTNDLVKIENSVFKTGTRIINEDGLMTCVTCGRSDWDYISDEPEWNGNADNEGPDMCRVGAPVNTTLYSESWGCSTIIPTRGVSFAMKRISRINFHNSMNHKDRSLHHAYEDLDRIGKGVLGLPDSIMNKAKIMYRQFNEEKLTRGAVRVGIKANCILRACSDSKIARTTQEIADAFEIPVRDISRTSDLFRETIPEENTSVTKPSDLVIRILNNVSCVSAEDRGRVCQKVIQACRDQEKNIRLMGKTPKGIASAVLYVTLKKLGYEIDKEEIRKICDVSLPTLNKLEKLIV